MNCIVKEINQPNTMMGDFMVMVMLYEICQWPYGGFYDNRCLKDGEFGLLLNVAKVGIFIYMYRMMGLT